MKKESFTQKQMLAAGLILLFLLISVILAWHTLQRAARRFSLDYFYPAFKTAAAAENYAAEKMLAATAGKGELAEAVRRLQQENLILAAENAAAEQLRRENEHLRGLLRLGPVDGYRTVHAEIILRDPITWNEVFTVDKGTSDGIREGDCVLAVHAAPGNGTGASFAAAVGRVTSVSSHTATVSTILNPECSFSVFLAESGKYGKLQGTGDGEMPLISALPLDSRYTTGEIVLTGGLSRQIPGGLYLGTLANGSDGSPARAANHLYAEAQMNPAAEIGKLHFVAILTGETEP